MFAKKLSVLLLGLVAFPSVAAARPAVRSDEARPAATFRAAARTDAARERTELQGPLSALCVRLHCTPDQITAIRGIRNETRERLAAERRDHRMLFAKMKAMRDGRPSDDDKAMLKAAIAEERRQSERLLQGGILGIANVLDDHQRELFLARVEKVGAKAVLGMGGRSAKGKSFAARTRGGDERERAVKNQSKRERAAKADLKRERAAKADAKRDRTAKIDAKRDRKAAKPARKVERQSAKA